MSGPLGDGAVRATGDEAVDAALADLGRLDPEAALEQHVVVLTGVHEALQRRLSATQG